MYVHTCICFEIPALEIGIRLNNFSLLELHCMYLRFHPWLTPNRSSGAVGVWLTCILYLFDVFVFCLTDENGIPIYEDGILTYEILILNYHEVIKSQSVTPSRYWIDVTSQLHHWIYRGSKACSFETATKAAPDAGSVGPAEIKLLLVGLCIFFAQLGWCIVAFLFNFIPNPNGKLWLINSL